MADAAGRVRVTVDGRPVAVPEGTLVAAAVALAGAASSRQSVRGEPRGPLCGMGACHECRVAVDGRLHVLGCLTVCRAGMRVETSAASAGPHQGPGGIERVRCAVAVVGGGPAGLAAAAAAAGAGADVALVDANPELGGQVWRRPGGIAAARRPLQRVRETGVRVFGGTSVVAARPGALLAENGAGVLEVRYERAVLAPGARERLLPFPGWTLPGVTGAGGLQALVKGGLPISGRRVVVSGSGPLLLAAAAYLRGRGAAVALIAEQAPWPRLAAFARNGLGDAARLRQAAGLLWRLRGVPLLAGWWVARAHGHAQLEGVTLRSQDGQKREVVCDHLACGFGLVPNGELPALIGCQTAELGVPVDGRQETNVPGVYCAGEATGVAGLEAALAEGEIAGLAAAGREGWDAALTRRRDAGRRFGAALAEAFALRPELRELPGADEVVCRCEDVAYGELEARAGWRDAKLQTRCGMGPCQGRVCGPAAAFLLGWRPDSARAPLTPARLATLARLDGGGET